MRYSRCLFFIGGSMRHQIQQLQRLQQQLEALNNIMAQLDSQRTNEIAPPSKLFVLKHLFIIKYSKY